MIYSTHHSKRELMSKTCTYPDCMRGCYGEFCLMHKPRKPINKFGKQAKKNAKTTKEFIERLKSEADQYGTVYCYLQISPLCPKRLSLDQVVPEHVLPKSGNPELRHDQSNIKAACIFCNNMKGSQRL